MRYAGQILSYQDKKYVQVNKTKAVKLFNEGISIALQSSNMRFNGVWQGPCIVNISTMEYENDQFKWHGAKYSPFDLTTSDYKYYNCDSERGNYINFFAEQN